MTGDVPSRSDDNPRVAFTRAVAVWEMAYAEAMISLTGASSDEVRKAKAMLICKAEHAAMVEAKAACDTYIDRIDQESRRAMMAIRESHELAAERERRWAKMDGKEESS